uniref:Uncharacterized protein n=1 Tax=Salvator merianae TaxID=96440 RepID=A0A8D0E8L7_SALMN
MIAATKPWPVMIAVTLCILFCLGTLVDAYPLKEPINFTSVPCILNAILRVKPGKSHSI